MGKQSRKQFLKTCALCAAAGPVVLKGILSAQPAEPEKPKMTAYCGLNCAECPAYIATQKNDDALRAETAKKWSEMFKADIKASDVNCDGCPTDSERVFNYCRICEIRKCAREKKLATCADCPEYPCQKLNEFLAQAPEAKAALEELRKKK